MSYGTRRVSNQNNNNNNNNSNSRNVSFNAGGLNERFSQYAQSRKKISNGNTRNNDNNNNSNASRSSVFSRLRGAKEQPERKRPISSNIQLRLGKINGGGIKKKTNEKMKQNAVKGIGKSSKTTARVTKRAPVTKTMAKNQKNKAQKAKPQKKPTMEDLDNSLDDYMMKDPKTAQAKLDAELTTYMDEASLLEEENM